MESKRTFFESQCYIEDQNLVDLCENMELYDLCEKVDKTIMFDSKYDNELYKLCLIVENNDM